MQAVISEVKLQKIRDIVALDSWDGVYQAIRWDISIVKDIRTLHGVYWVGIETLQERSKWIYMHQAIRHETLAINH